MQIHLIFWIIIDVLNQPPYNSCGSIEGMLYLTKRLLQHLKFPIPIVPDYFLTGSCEGTQHVGNDAADTTSDTPFTQSGLCLNTGEFNSCNLIHSISFKELFYRLMILFSAATPVRVMALNGQEITLATKFCGMDIQPSRDPFECLREVDGLDNFDSESFLQNASIPLKESLKQPSANWNGVIETKRIGQLLSRVSNQTQKLPVDASVQQRKSESQEIILETLKKVAQKPSLYSPVTSPPGNTSPKYAKPLPRWAAHYRHELTKILLSQHTDAVKLLRTSLEKYLIEEFPKFHKILLSKILNKCEDRQELTAKLPKSPLESNLAKTARANRDIKFFQGDDKIAQETIDKDLASQKCPLTDWHHFSNWETNRTLDEILPYWHEQEGRDFIKCSDYHFYWLLNHPQMMCNNIINESFVSFFRPTRNKLFSIIILMITQFGFSASTLLSLMTFFQNNGTVENSDKTPPFLVSRMNECENDNLSLVSYSE